MSDSEDEYGPALPPGQCGDVIMPHVVSIDFWQYKVEVIINFY